MTSKNEAKVTGHTKGRSEKRRRRGRERERERERERKEREKDPRLVVVRVFFYTAPPYWRIMVRHGTLQPIGCTHWTSPEHPFPRPYLNIGMSEMSDTVETLVVCREACSATLFL